MSRRFLDNCLFTVNIMFKRTHDLSFTTKRDYLYGVQQMIRELHKGGYQVSHIRHLKPRHGLYLLQQWQNQGLGAGTIKNRLAQLRYVGDAIGKPDLLPKLNKELNVEQRTYLSSNSKALHSIDLSKFADPFTRYSIQLQRHFGLRREEAIKFIVSQADKGAHITLAASWTKGGVERNVPITTLEQRALLDELKNIIGRNRSLIPLDKSYAEQRNLYDAQVAKSGYYNLHGLRHAYAQKRYETLTHELTQGKGWPSPHAGGKSQKDMTPEERAVDKQARLLLSNELGHSREQITNVYCGS